MLFENFREAHFHYKYPSSYRIGTVGNETGVIRSYSNGQKKDIIKDYGKKIYYVLKNDNVKDLFRLNKKSKKKVRFFRKVEDGVLDMGLYHVHRFYKNYVVLLK